MSSWSRAKVDQMSNQMIQVKEMMQDNDLKNQSQKIKLRSRSPSMIDQSIITDKTKTRQSINVKSHIFNVIGSTEEFEERDLNIGGDYDMGTKVATVSNSYLLKHYLRGGISKEVETPRYLNLVVPLTKVGDEAVHKELGDRMERAATTDSSLEAKQDSGNIKLRPNLWQHIMNQLT
ncbi:hypothetical protein Tco_1251681 [Tanacetum coccineum]